MMRTGMLISVIFILCGFVRSESLEELTRPFMESAPYRVYVINIQPPKPVYFAGPIFEGISHRQFVFALQDTLHRDSTAYILTTEYVRDNESSLFCIFADSSQDINTISSIATAPAGDTVSVWSNSKPVAKTIDEMLIQQKLARRYRNFVGKYLRQKETQSDERLRFYMYGTLATALSTVGTLLLFSDDTKNQNAGGICLGVGILGYIEGIIRYLKAKPHWNDLSNDEHTLKNWSQDDTDKLLEEPTGK